METKKFSRSIHILQLFMLFLNIISIMGISVFIYVTIENIRKTYAAREFLNRVSAVAPHPEKTIWICASMLFLLIIGMTIRERLFTGNHKVIIISLIMDFFFSFVIIFLLNFNYNGILLLLFANVIMYVNNGKSRYIFVAIAITSFILTDYELLSVSNRLYSVHDYISFYNISAQQYFLSVLNVIVSLNFIGFVVYCILIINEQQGNIEKIHRLNEKLQEYSVMAEKMAETRERNRLAREIHDTLGHTLTGIATGIDACLAIIKIDPDKTKKQLEIISGVTRDGLKDIRRSVSELRPDALERFSLEYAVNKMVADINAVSGTRVTFDCQLQDISFDEDEENTIYRIVQESITNAIRHGRADVINIFIKKEPSGIIINISDNGIGCADLKPGFGTKHILERVKMLNGSVLFDGSNGFCVMAKLPIRNIMGA